MVDLTDYLDDDYDKINIHIQQFFAKSNNKEYQDISLNVIATVHKIRVRNWRTASQSKLSSPLT